MIEHLKLHGPNRFKCLLCDINLPSTRAITVHMKTKHNILNLEYLPETPELTDLDKDKFVVTEKKILTKKKRKDNHVDSFNCGECSFKGNTRKIVVLHMKNVHNIDEYTITPEISSSINNRKYLIQGINKSINFLMPQEQSSSGKIKRNVSIKI